MDQWDQVITYRGLIAQEPNFYRSRLLSIDFFPSCQGSQIPSTVPLRSEHLRQKLSVSLFAPETNLFQNHHIHEFLPSWTLRPTSNATAGLAPATH